MSKMQTQPGAHLPVSRKASSPAHTCLYLPSARNAFCWAIDLLTLALSRKTSNARHCRRTALSWRPAAEHRQFTES